jgi:hypothetical protein
MVMFLSITIFYKKPNTFGATIKSKYKSFAPYSWSAPVFGCGSPQHYGKPGVRFAHSGLFAHRRFAAEKPVFRSLIFSLPLPGVRFAAQDTYQRNGETEEPRHESRTRPVTCQAFLCWPSYPQSALAPILLGFSGSASPYQRSSPPICRIWF